MSGVFDGALHKKALQKMVLATFFSPAIPIIHSYGYFTDNRGDLLFYLRGIEKKYPS